MLKNKNIVVTGAGSGIGQATSLLAASYGANVLCVDLTDGADATAAQIVQDGGSALAHRGKSHATVKIIVPELQAPGSVHDKHQVVKRLQLDLRETHIVATGIAAPCDLGALGFHPPTGVSLVPFLYPSI